MYHNIYIGSLKYYRNIRKNVSVIYISKYHTAILYYFSKEYTDRLIYGKSSNFTKELFCEYITIINKHEYFKVLKRTTNSKQAQ